MINDCYQVMAMKAPRLGQRGTQDTAEGKTKIENLGRWDNPARFGWKLPFRLRQHGRAKYTLSHIHIDCIYALSLWLNCCEHLVTSSGTAYEVLVFGGKARKRTLLFGAGNVEFFGS